MPHVFYGLGPGAFTKTAGTSLSVGFPTAPIPPDRTLLMYVLMDNLTASTPVVSSISSPGGGMTWVKRTEVNSPIATAAGGVRAELWELTVTQEIPTSYAAVLTFSGSIVAKAAQIGIFDTLGPYSGATVYPGTWPVGSGGGGAFSTQLIATESNVPPTITQGLSHLYPPAVNQNAFTFGSTGSGAAANVYASVAYFRDGGSSNTTTTWATTDGGGFMAVWGAPTAPVLAQAAYQFYGDGTESGSVALAAQNTAPTLDISNGDVPFQIRVRVQENGTAPVPLSSDFPIQFEKNASGVWVSPQSASALLVAYPEINENFGTTSSLNTGQSVGVQVLGDGRPLTRVGFRVSYTVNPPTGVMSAAVVASSGALGAAGAKMTGPALASSTNTIPSSQVTYGSQWFYFDFDGSLVLDAGVPYFLVISSTSTDTSSSGVAIDISGPSYAGNYSWGVINGATNTAVGTDVIFEAFVLSDATGVAVFASSLLDNNALSTNRLTGGTGSFVPGDITEDGNANAFGWLTPGNHSELVYSLKLVAADLVNGDVIRFRVQRDYAVLNTYTVTPTINVFKGAATLQASGITPIVSATSGDATVVQSASGTTPIVSALAGGVTSSQLVSGITTIASAISGAAIKSPLVAAGTLAIVSATTGAATLRGVGAGVIPIVSALAGAATMRGVGAGVILIVSTTTGSATPGTVTWQASGVIPISSVEVGAVTQSHSIEYVDWALAGYP